MNTQVVPLIRWGYVYSPAGKPFVVVLPFLLTQLSQQNCAEYVFFYNTSPKASSVSRTLIFIVLEIPHVLSMGLLVDHE